MTTWPSFLYRIFVKRVIDVIISFWALLGLLPVFVIASLLIRLTSEGPIFFKQSRLGRYGRVFVVYKFRTMASGPRSMQVQVTADNPEITSVGHFLRRFKIDELPQLFNVFNGEMSLIGPRPCLPETEKIFNDDGRSRLVVRPGLTGLAQVNGNIKLSWEERWAWDHFYVENLSLTLDATILLKTFLVIIFGEEYFCRKHQ